MGIRLTSKEECDGEEGFKECYPEEEWDSAKENESTLIVLIFQQML